MHLENYPLERKPLPAPLPDERWRPLAKQVKAYGWLSLAGTLVGTLRLAHPRLFGKPRPPATKGRPPVWAFHLIEVPLVSFISFVSLYAIRRFTRANARRTLMLLGSSQTVSLAFFTFESVLLVDSFWRGAPKYEKRTYAWTAALLLAGAGMAQWLRLRMNDYLYPPLDPRFVHPRTEAELVQLVKYAGIMGIQIRVRGSMHCVPQGIFTDDGGQHINVQLDQYTQILKWEEGRDERGELLRVTVQAGCHLGVDPNDPLSNKRNSLLWQLERGGIGRRWRRGKGWALPDLGGITHQTVSGFLSTGSMGGTTQYDLGEAIVGIRLIDGTGEVRDLAPDPSNPNDEQENPFYAAGVSMGLLGIISSVTLECRPRYDLKGQQETHKTGQCPIKLFESGEHGLQRYLEEDEYTHTRMLWWPQPGVDKVEIWKARRTQPDDKKTTLFRGRVRRGPLVAVPPIIQALVVSPFYHLISCDALPYEPTTACLVRKVINAFVREGPPKQFWGPWLEILPMDNSISDKHMPVDFTEMFIDISETQQVMTKLKEFFAGDTGDLARVGPFAFELYAGHKSRFWLSPSYGRHSFRVDVFWFHTNMSGREEFFAHFWKLLQESTSGFRLHWGKYLPDAESPTGAKYLHEQYPMWDRFMEVRRKMDPYGVFLSTYWKKHLGLEDFTTDLEPESSPPQKPMKGGGGEAAQAAGTPQPRNAMGSVAAATRRGRVHMSIAIVKSIHGLNKLLSRPDRPQDTSAER